MSEKRKLALAGVILLAFLCAGCQQAVEDESVGVANPASVYCEEQGGRLEIRTDEEGNQYGMCLFPDGSACEEWAFYRGECEPGMSDAQAESSPEEAVDEVEIAVPPFPWRGAVIELCHEGYKWGCEDETGYPPLESFRQLHALGANVAFIQTQYVWSLLPPYQPDEVEYARLEAALDAAAKAGLPVVLSVRNGPGRNEMMPDVDTYLTAIYEDEAAQQAYIDMLVDLIGRFKDRPEIIAWEPMVEPTPHTYFDPEQSWDEARLIEAERWWHGFASRAIAAMRAADPVRAIVIEPSLWGGAEAFAWMEPYDDDNLIYCLHTYDPTEYTHQIDPPYEITYPGKIDGQTFDRAWLDAHLEPVRAFQDEHQVPILVGEWGAVRWLPGAADYLTDQRDLFEAEGWSWAIYAWSDQVWATGGFEPIYGPDRDNTISDAYNPLFAPILEGWALNKP